MIEILHIQIVWQLPDMANLSVSQPLFIFRNYDKDPHFFCPPVMNLPDFSVQFTAIQS
jgi:hypothetical protein